MKVQWCPECHWEKATVTASFDVLGPIFGALRHESCPRCAYWPVLDVDNGK